MVAGADHVTLMLPIDVRLLDRGGGTGTTALALVELAESARQR
jgi:hypothetical protein